MTVPKRSLLILASPRSGTNFVAHLLRHATRLHVGHEIEGQDVTISYRHTHRVGHYHRVFHQTRDPLHAVCSGQLIEAGWDGFWWRDGEPIFRSMLAYRELNTEFEAASPELRFRVEDLPWEALVSAAGVPGCPLPTVREKWRHSLAGQYEPLSWDDLYAVNAGVARDLGRMAERYGYETKARV